MKYAFLAIATLWDVVPNVFYFMFNAIHSEFAAIYTQAVAPSGSLCSNSSLNGTAELAKQLPLSSLSNKPG